MKINFPFTCNTTNLFQKNTSSVFNPLVPNNLPYQNNFINISSPPNFHNIWNKYQNLYSQIISHDKTAINFKKERNQNSIKYKPFVSNIKIIYNEDSNNDKMDTLLGNKTQRTDEKKEKNKKRDVFEINKSTSTNNESFNNKSNRGRKKKDVIEKGNHTKFTDDNMMRKIKCHFLNSINNKLNNSLKDKKQPFLKLDNMVNENLKRDYNMVLMNKTIKDIYLSSKISNKYKKQNNDYNKQLVEKIYLENKEIGAIKILDKTYIQLFDELIRDKLNEFCEEILKKEERNGLPVEQSSCFLEKMKNLSKNYKDWFEKKRGRGRKIFKI